MWISDFSGFELGLANHSFCIFEENASYGKSTYVHCKAGRGRSTTVVLCYLVCKLALPSFYLRKINYASSYRVIQYLTMQVQYKQMTPITAYEYVKLRRPRVHLAPSQWQVWLKILVPLLFSGFLSLLILGLLSSFPFTVGNEIPSFVIFCV